MNQLFMQSIGQKCMHVHCLAEMVPHKSSDDKLSVSHIIRVDELIQCMHTLIPQSRSVTADAVQWWGDFSGCTAPKQIVEGLKKSQAHGSMYADMVWEGTGARD